MDADTHTKQPHYRHTLSQTITQTQVHTVTQGHRHAGHTQTWKPQSYTHTPTPPPPQTVTWCHHTQKHLYLESVTMT